MKTDEDGYVTLEVRSGPRVRGTIRRKPKTGRMVIGLKGSGLRRQFRVTVTGRSYVVRDQDGTPYVSTAHDPKDLKIELEWIVTDHAANQAQVRFDCALETCEFEAQPVTVDGLRLYLDKTGCGLLVREASGTYWATNTVITVYGRDFVSAKLASGRLKNEGLPSDVVRMFWPALALIKDGTSVTGDVMDALGCSQVDLSNAISQLNRSRYIERTSQKQWTVTRLGLAAYGDKS